MKKNNYLLSAVLCSGLCLAATLSGCNGGGNAVDAPGTKGDVTTPVSFGSLDKLQFVHSRFVPPTTLSGQTRTNDGLTTGFPTPEPDFPQVLRRTTSPTDGFPPTSIGSEVSVDSNSFKGTGTVTIGNIGIAFNDQGAFSLSGTISPTAGEVSSDPNFGPTVHTAISPDRKFAYAISSVGVVPQALNITAPAVSTPASNVINATVANITIANTTTVSAVNTEQTRVTSYGAYGSNRVTTLAVDQSNGALVPPPFSLNTRLFGTQGTFTYAAVHPSGSFLYIFGDDLTVNVAGTNPNVAEIDAPFTDTVSYHFDTNAAPNVFINGTVGNATAVPPIAPIPANITFVPVAESSGRTIGRRGFVIKANLNRATGQPDFVTSEITRLPAGFATPNHAVFGPNGTDLYLACYNVATGAVGRRVNAGAVLHYKLSTSGSAITGSLPVAPTAQVVLPGGTHSLAFSQGSRRLYASCQVDGSIRCLTIDPNTGALARQISGDLVGLAAPGSMVAHPTFDRLYVAESSQSNVGLPAGSVSGGRAIKVLGINSSTGVLSQLFSETLTMPNTRQLGSITIDPNGLVLYSHGGSEGLPSLIGDATTTSFRNDIGEVGVHKINADGSTRLVDILGLTGHGRLGEVYKLATPLVTGP